MLTNYHQIVLNQKGHFCGILWPRLLEALFAKGEQGDLFGAIGTRPFFRFGPCVQILHLFLSLHRKSFHAGSATKMDRDWRSKDCGHWYTAKLGRAVKRRDFLCNSLFNTSCSRLQGWAYLSYGSYACTGIKGIIEWLWESKSDPSRSNLSHGICCGTLWKKVQPAEKPKTIDMSWQELTPFDFKTQSGLISKIEWRWNRSVQTKRKYSNLIHQGVPGATAGARATHHLVFLALHINMNIQNQTQFQTTTIYLNCPPTSSTLINYQSFIANHQSSIVNQIINSQPSIIYLPSLKLTVRPWK